MRIAQRGAWAGSVLIGTLWACLPAVADNGAVAYTYPADGIQVDAKLDDWPAQATWNPIRRYAGSAPSRPGDFEARFRTAYDPATRQLFVAVEVEDDTHVVREAGDEDASWNNQDSHLLYLDIDHLPGRSAPVLLQSAEHYREFTLADRREPPTAKPTSYDDATVAIRRSGTTTVYEWRVQMGQGFRPGRSIGIDHLLHDADEDGDGSFLHWGPQMGKSSNAGRLGDLLPLDEEAPLGLVRGQISWDQPNPAPLPQRITLTSTENPETWLQADVDEGGRFQLHLPIGSYHLALPHSISDPFGGWGHHQVRIELVDASTTVQVTEGQITDVPTIQVAAFRRPDFLLPETGVLPDFDPTDRTDVAELDYVTETYRRFFAIPGVSLALFKEGKVVYHRTFGTQNHLTGRPVAQDTLFEAASISKPVFAYAFMRLVDQGLIDLDRPLHEVLPFDNIADDPRSKKITARLVLSHQAGLPNWPFGGVGGFRNGDTRELMYEPGEGYSYSGTMINYLGRVAEKLTGKQIEQIVKEQTLDTMGMTGTYFTDNDVVAAKKSMGHYHTLPNFSGNPTEASMASSMHTEAVDLARFAIGLMEGRGLRPETQAEMWKRHLEVPRDDDPDDLPPSYAALGFFWQPTGVGMAVGHGGNNGDFQCEMLMVPDKKLGFVVMTNNNVGHKLAEVLIDYLYDGRRNQWARGAS